MTPCRHCIYKKKTQNPKIFQCPVWQITTSWNSSCEKGSPVLIAVYDGKKRFSTFRKETDEDLERMNNELQGPSVQPQPEEDCATCKHGYFGDRQCDNCSVRFPSHYERKGEHHD